MPSVWLTKCNPVKDTESNPEGQEKDYQRKRILTCSLKYK